MDISVVISTCNNCERLRITLGAMAQCRVPPERQWELVLVNNNCTDATDEVAKEFAGRIPLRYLHEPTPGVSFGRNAGLRAASGELILCTDDDVRPCPDWLEVYWEAYREKPNGFYFGGPIESEFETVKPSEELLRLAPPSVRGLDYGKEPRVLGADEQVVGGNWACPAQALKGSGGYSTAPELNYAPGRLSGGEETDLMERLGKGRMRAWYLPGARVKHFVPARKCTLEHIAARAQASGQAGVLMHYTEYAFHPRILGLPRWIYRRLASWWLKWGWARLRGRKGYREYCMLRAVLGEIQGFRELTRRRRLGPEPGTPEG